MEVQFQCENVGLDTYLVYALNSGDELDRTSIGMLSNNTIDGFCPLLFTQMNDDIFVKYNITGLVTLKSFFNAPVNKKNLVSILLHLTESIIEADEYMIESDSLLLDVDSIYLNISKMETFLICLPVENYGSGISVAGFFRKFITSITYDSTENCGYMAEIFNFLNGQGTFSIEEFKSLLLRLSGESNSLGKPPVTPTTATTSAQKNRQEINSISTKKAQSGTTATNFNGTGITKIGQQSTVSVPPKTGLSSKPPVPPHKKETQGGSSAEIGPVPGTKQKDEADDSEKMSLGYLLKHYSKENLEAYKNSKAAGEQKTEKRGSAKPSGKKNKVKPAEKPDFSIPGQPGSDPISKPGAVPPLNKPTKFPGKASTSTTQKADLGAGFSIGGGNGPAESVDTVKGSFGATVYLKKQPVSKTTSLNIPPNASPKSAMIVRNRTKQTYILDRPLMKIGRERDFVDIAIPDNSSVSAEHAQIQTRGNEYILMDTNSTNHTYVNGTIIPSSSEYVLKDGDQIVFSDEVFSFIIQ